MTRLTDDSTDTLPTHRPLRFAEPRLEECDADDEQMIEAALAEINDRIMQGFYSLCLAPSQAPLQSAFARLVAQRDAFAKWLATR